MLRLWCLLAALSITLTGADKCVDLVNNVVKVGNTGTNPIMVNNNTFGTYDLQVNPTCFNKKANLELPGEIIALSGEKVALLAYDSLVKLIYML